MTLILQMLTTGNALLVAPVMCLSRSAACIDEIRSGMFKNILYRTDKASYIQSKAMACLISGAMTLMASALLATLISVVLLLPRETTSVIGDVAASPENIQSPLIRQLIGLIFRYGCFGAVWSLVGMLLSLGTFNRLMAWIGPFIVDYLWKSIRYFDGLGLFYQKWLVMSWSWPLKDWGICLVAAVSGRNELGLMVRRTGMSVWRQCGIKEKWCCRWLPIISSDGTKMQGLQPPFCWILFSVTF